MKALGWFVVLLALALVVSVVALAVIALVLGGLITLIRSA